MRDLTSPLLPGGFPTVSTLAEGRRRSNGVGRRVVDPVERESRGKGVGRDLRRLRLELATRCCLSRVG